MAKHSKSLSTTSGNHLWKYRKRMGFSQEEVAAILGHVNATHVSVYERGRKLPSFITALKLEIVYRVPVAFLFPDLYIRLKTSLRAREERLRAKWDGGVEEPRGRPRSAA